MKKNKIINVSIVIFVITIVLFVYHINRELTMNSTINSSKQSTTKTVVSETNSTPIFSSKSSPSVSSSEHDQASTLKQSSSISASSVVNDPDTPSYDPNKTAQGTEVTSDMITKVRNQLVNAGLPADKWAPSDIKKIITEASQQNMSIIDYAKANYHQ
ncbi:hypothetical protein ACUIJP_06115 [Leuconostoc pseudomesenteroides]|uniref:hypothetical protein n=1 Tax=Leuconostoc pseudomesenteroides TaxID=33968 RepID=UPI00403DCCD5